MVAYLKDSSFYESRAWREVRYRTLRAQGFRCKACGANGDHTVLHVDHIKPRSKYPELELDETNLQVLCEDCNLGKSNHFEDRFVKEDFATKMEKLYRQSYNNILKDLADPEFKHNLTDESKERLRLKAETWLKAQALRERARRMKKYAKGDWENKTLDSIIEFMPADPA